MQRVTLTLDDDLLAALDALSARRGYHNRSEAVRDILRDALNQDPPSPESRRGYAVLSYVYEHEKRELASRLVLPSIIITISPSPRCMCISVMTTAWRLRC